MTSTQPRSALEIHEGTGWPDNPFIVRCNAISGSSALLELLGEHMRDMAMQRQWLSFQMIDHTTHEKGLQTLQSFEVNYEQFEEQQIEYFSAVVWYDISEPWGLITATEHPSH